MDGMCGGVDGHMGTYPGDESGQIPGGAIQGQKMWAESTVLTSRGDLWGRGGDEITRAAWPQCLYQAPCRQAPLLPDGPHCQAQFSHLAQVVGPPA